VVAGVLHSIPIDIEPPTVVPQRLWFLRQEYFMLTAVPRAIKEGIKCKLVALGLVRSLKERN